MPTYTNLLKCSKCGGLALRAECREETVGRVTASSYDRSGNLVGSSEGTQFVLVCPISDCGGEMKERDL